MRIYPVNFYRGNIKTEIVDTKGFKKKLKGIINMEDKQEIEFIPEEKNNNTKIKLLNLWSDIIFGLTMSYFVIKGYIMWFLCIGSIEIEVGYEEDGKEKNYLYLEKLW